MNRDDVCRCSFMLHEQQKISTSILSMHSQSAEEAYLSGSFLKFVVHRW